jgi:hypothetical protein
LAKYTVGHRCALIRAGRDPIRNAVEDLFEGKTQDSRIQPTGAGLEVADSTKYKEAGGVNRIKRGTVKVEAVN